MQADEMIARVQRLSRQQSLSLTMTSLRRSTALCSHGVTETKLIPGIVSARNCYDPDASSSQHKLYENIYLLHWHRAIECLLWKCIISNCCA